MVNFAERQRAMDEGRLTLDQCYQLGRAHAAYGWGCSNWFGYPWTEDQRASYRRGFKEYAK